LHAPSLSDVCACKALLDSTWNVIKLIQGCMEYPSPEGFTERLHERLRKGYLDAKPFSNARPDAEPQQDTPGRETFVANSNHTHGNGLTFLRSNLRVAVAPIDRRFSRQGASEWRVLSSL